MILVHMAGQIQLDQFPKPPMFLTVARFAQWSAAVLLPDNNMVKLCSVFSLSFVLSFFLLFLFYPEGGLRPGLAELWSRSTPTGMRIVSDLRAAPLASSLPFKAANCRGHKARATADCLLREARGKTQAFSLQTSWNQLEGLSQVLHSNTSYTIRRPSKAPM